MTDQTMTFQQTVDLAEQVWDAADRAEDEERRALLARHAELMQGAEILADIEGIDFDQPEPAPSPDPRP